MVGVGNRRKPTSETDVFQPTVHCRRLASKHADNRLYMQLARKKPLYMSFLKSPTRKIQIKIVLPRQIEDLVLQYLRPAYEICNKFETFQGHKFRNMYLRLFKTY